MVAGEGVEPPTRGFSIPGSLRLASALGRFSADSNRRHLASATRSCPAEECSASSGDQAYQGQTAAGTARPARCQQDAAIMVPKRATPRTIEGGDMELAVES